MESAPEGDEIEHAQGREKQRAKPFPAPGHRQDEQQEARRDEVDQEGKEGVPETVIFVKHIQGKNADEAGKEETNDSWRPEQTTFCRCFHNFVRSQG